MRHVHTDATPAMALRTHGFRVTSGRVRLLQLLAKGSRPLSIREIRSEWKDAPDQATLYRTLTDLAKVGIVQRIDLNTGIAHFEYAPGKPHHHHVVCMTCGTMEDIALCPQLRAPRTKKFKDIYSHNLEFFGLCRSCAK